MDFSSYSKFCCRFRTIFSTIWFNISMNLRHNKRPILLFPAKKCSVYLILLLKEEMRSAGLAISLELFVLLAILLPLLLCFSFETLPESILSTFCLVVLFVLRDCLPERVRERYNVCAVLLRYGAKGSGDMSRSYLSLFMLYLLRFLTKSSRLRSWCLLVYFLLACLNIQRLLKQVKNQHIKIDRQINQRDGGRLQLIGS